MTRSTRTRRTAFTLVEMLATLAVLVILGAAAVPGIQALSGNTKQKDAVEAVRNRMAEARGHAMTDNVPYRLAVHTDGKRVRVAPDGNEFASPPAEGQFASEAEMPGVTVGVVADSDAPPATDAGGWVTVATFRGDGTCREDNATVEVKEDGFPAILVQLRGLTGAVKVTTAGR